MSLRFKKYPDEYRSGDLVANQIQELEESHSDDTMEIPSVEDTPSMDID